MTSSRGFYEDLGVRPVVNAATMFTALGGSLMPEEVLDAMRAAAGSFVDMHELHLAAGRRLAELTGNEAALVTSGCAAALALGVLAARTDGDPARITDFPGHDEAPYEVIMHAAHRIPYDRALALAGARVRQIGDVIQTFDWELKAAIGPQTAAVVYVAGAHLPPGALPLEQVVTIAHERGVPVIVDAAAQLPPVDNLWSFTRDAGADLAVFSGGKTLLGPQSSGLMVGSAGLVEAARQNSAPYQRWARAMKVGKEEIAGLVAAVERYVALDHAAEHQGWMSVLEAWRDGLDGLAGAQATIEPLGEAGQPIPRLHIELPSPVRAERVLELIEASDPRVAVLADRAHGAARGLWLSPDLLQPGEAEIVRETIARALTEVPT